MHSGYGNIYEIVYASFVGLVIGYLFYRTRSLPLAVMIHGSINIFLFGTYSPPPPLNISVHRKMFRRKESKKEGSEKAEAGDIVKKTMFLTNPLPT